MYSVPVLAKEHVSDDGRVGRSIQQKFWLLIIKLYVNKVPLEMVRSMREQTIATGFWNAVLCNV
jgi:hypothetical protein